MGSPEGLRYRVCFSTSHDHDQTGPESRHS